MQNRPKNKRQGTAPPFEQDIEQDNTLYIGFIYSISNAPEKSALSDSSFPPHYHSSIELIIPVGLAGEVTVSGVHYPVHDNRIYCINSNAVHSTLFRPLKKNQCCVIRINPVLFEAWLAKTLGSEGVLESHMKSMSAVHIKKADMIKELVFQLSNISEIPSPIKEPNIDPVTVLSDISILCKIFSLLLQEKASLTIDASGDEWARATLTIIDSFCDHAGSIGEIAQRCNMSKYHFCRKFKKCTGITALHYLNRIRINRAQRLLLESGLSVTDACFETGFNNVSHFINVFSALTGTTPKQWVINFDTLRKAQHCA